MPLPTQNRTDPIYQNSWQSGMITSLPPEELPPDAAQDLMNVEFDIDSNLVTRNGTNLFLDTSEVGRITSLFRAEYSNGTVFILFTIGTQLFRVNEDGTGLTNITAALTFPNNTFWQWVMFDDFAIGVNQASSGTNPVKVSSAGTATLLNASAPFAKYCEVWNSRLWLSGVGTNQNTIFGSAINDPEDWTVDDDAGAITLGIDIGDGDAITGIKVFKGSLYIYKRRKINVVSAISAPATIPSNLRVDEYTSNLGCVSAYTIQNVIDDQLFLSDVGVASLTLAPLGEIKGAIVSQNIAELSRLKKTSDEFTSIVMDDMKQYWLSVPSALSSTGSNEVWVMDYEKVNQRDQSGFPLVRWVRMSGLVAGTAYCEKLDGDFKTYLIGAYDITAVDTPIYSYTPNDPIKQFNDNGVLYVQRILSKAYAPSSSLLRSLWHRFGGSIGLVSASLNLLAFYYFDNKSSAAGSYTFAFTAAGGSVFLYGSSLYGTATYSDADSLDIDRVFWRQFRKNASGRKARTVSIELRCNTVDQGFILKFLHVENTLLNFRRTRNV